MSNLCLVSLQAISSVASFCNYCQASQKGELRARPPKHARRCSNHVGSESDGANLTYWRTLEKRAKLLPHQTLFATVAMQPKHVSNEPVLATLRIAYCRTRAMLLSTSSGLGLDLRTHCFLILPNYFEECIASRDFHVYSTQAQNDVPIRLPSTKLYRVPSSTTTATSQ